MQNGARGGGSGLSPFQRRRRTTALVVRAHALHPSVAFQCVFYRLRSIYLFAITRELVPSTECAYQEHNLVLGVHSVLVEGIQYTCNLLAFLITNAQICPRARQSARTPGWSMV